MMIRERYQRKWHSLLCWSRKNTNNWHIESEESKKKKVEIEVDENKYEPDFQVQHIKGYIVVNRFIRIRIYISLATNIVKVQ